MLLAVIAQAQTTDRLNIIDNFCSYKKTIKAAPEKQMVELKKAIPSIVYDLRYASKNNFMHQIMYPSNTTISFLRVPATEALVQVQQELRENGLGLKVFDAYRPFSVSKKFWELIKDERYVANPAKGSNHNRGTAVDLTIINLKNGTELNMGTGFDNFTDSAHHSFKNLPEEVLQNRALLKTTMEKYGFIPLETEWWHYTYKSNIDFEVLDIPFKKLNR